eukprot:CAMPEP_0170493044 /NCGR_PEP_ID=MMETSP0208-20121228/13264_1 /TAXON_ID=197538 /ORGANISM="Strombidium inclinatum, Strain S3" /LENGTH=108 /DNA_ID=CAMNT_0010768901 /DNA_START=24 /DNA_END=350 /DNA_ORIENTATION=-
MTSQNNFTRKAEQGTRPLSKRASRVAAEKNLAKIDEDSDSSPENSSDLLATSMTNKKMEYLATQIVDKSGKYTFKEDPEEYRKARKRQQNRESAVRSRLRKVHYQQEV